jgi:hypothetical protein
MQQQQVQSQHQRAPSNHPTPTRYNIEVSSPTPANITTVTATTSTSASGGNQYDTENHYYHYSAKLEEEDIVRNSGMRSRNNSQNEIKESTKYQKRVFKYPAADPKLFANHLVWNNNKKTAEPVDDDDDERMGSNCFKKTDDFSPITRGGLSPESNDRNCVYSDLADTSVNNLSNNGQQYHHHFYHQNNYGPTTANDFKNIYSRVADSAVNKVSQQNGGKQMNKCNDSENNNNNNSSMPSVTLRTSFSSRNKPNGNVVINQSSSNFKKDLAENEYCLSTSADSCLNEPFCSDNERGGEYQHHHNKVVGGVKVFPSMPYDYNYKQAADVRRSRLSEIEQKLAEIEVNNNLRKQASINGRPVHLEHSNSSVGTNSKPSSNEIIDLTNSSSQSNSSSNNNNHNYNQHSENACYKRSPQQSSKLDMNKILYGSSVSLNNNNNNNNNSSAPRNVPIQVTTKVSRNNEFESDSINFRHEKKTVKVTHAVTSEEEEVSNHIHNQHHQHQQKHQRQEVAVNGADLQKIYCKSDEKKKGNSYVYYYDNSEHFCGY